MKKKIIIYAILLLSIAVGSYFLPRLFVSNSQVDFEVARAADFTIVSPNAISFYQFQDRQVKEVSNVKVQLPEVVDPWFAKGEFDQKYLSFSTGDLLEATKDERLISIDFDKGTIKQTVTPHYAYTGSGFSDNYFYTFQATTGDGGVYQFDPLGEELASYQFEQSTTASSQFVGSDGKLYILATQVSKDDENIYETHLFTFEEDSLKLLDQIPLDDNEDVTYGYTNSAIVGDNLYSGVTAVRDRKSYEMSPSKQIAEINLKTKEKNFFNLTENFPNLVYSAKSGEYVIFVHEPSSLGKTGVSILDRKSKQSEFVDISEILGNTDIDATKIVSVNTAKDNQLFILTKLGLVIWDMETNKLLALEKELGNDSFYVWVNE